MIRSTPQRMVNVSDFHVDINSFDEFSDISFYAAHLMSGRCFACRKIYAAYSSEASHSHFLYFIEYENVSFLLNGDLMLRLMNGTRYFNLIFDLTQ